MAFMIRSWPFEIQTGAFQSSLTFTTLLSFHQATFCCMQTLFLDEFQMVPTAVVQTQS